MKMSLCLLNKIYQKYNIAYLSLSCLIMEKYSIIMINRYSFKKRLILCVFFTAFSCVAILNLTSTEF